MEKHVISQIVIDTTREVKLLMLLFASGILTWQEYQKALEVQ